MFNIKDLNNYSMKKLIDELIDRYDTQYQNLLKEFNSLPNKTLCVNKNGKYIQYRAYDLDDKTVTSINSDKKLVAKLCRREIVNLSLIHIKTICDALHTIKFAQGFEFVDDILNQLKPIYREIDNSYFMTDPEKVKKWLSQPKDNFRIEDLTVTNEYNESFRSKSEVIIANALHKHNVPFIYELPLQLDNFIAHPDFTIMRLYDYKIFYWEHFGLSDDPKYMESQENKLAIYNEYNICEGDNLIITKEEDIIGKNNILKEIILKNF